VSHGHDDYHVEPVPGLPEALPKDERILWQGAPAWRAVAREVFHIRAVTLYFALLMAWRGGSHFADSGVSAALLSIASLLPVAAFGLGLLVLLARLVSRTTLYTITNRRVVMRIGMALPVTINVPFTLVAAAGLRRGPGGTGDIPLTLSGDQRIAYSWLWPHVRPWHLRMPEPMLRGVPEVERVAAILGKALGEAAPGAVNAANQQVRRPVTAGAMGASLRA
jgi:hypothetical protein